MDEPQYDLVLRDPEGGVLERWPLDTSGFPCTGQGAILFEAALWKAIVQIARDDMAARKENT